MNPLFAALLVMNPNGSFDVRIERVREWSSLVLGGNAFHKTAARINGLKTIKVPGSPVHVILWDETTGASPVHFSAVSLTGNSVARVEQTSDQLQLKFGTFDPTVAVPAVDKRLKASDGNQMFIVQFASQPLEEYRAAIRELGGDVQNYLPDNAYVVQISPDNAAKVRGLPYVRWVGALEPGWKVDPGVQQKLKEGTLSPDHYYVQISGDDRARKSVIASQIRFLGAAQVLSPEQGTMMEADLTPDQVVAAAKVNGVLWIEKAGAPEVDMDNVRVLAGANYVDTVAGYRGQGVIAHDIDGGIRATHQAFTGRLTTRGTVGINSHGTCTSGIVFGNGTGNAAGKGMMPESNMVVSVYTVPWSGGGPARLAWTQDTVNNYHCVVETNSWGDPLVPGTYTSISSYMDEIIFKTDLVICQSMSNAGSTQGRPQAWAKNIVGVGATNHFNNQNLADDRWNNGATIGPAADGRSKPELMFYYDSILCTDSGNDTNYTTGFGGTSAATPMTAGAFGLLMQMWGQGGEFGNTNLGTTVFDNRPHAAPARALMINQANLYPQGQADITRNVQGWGMPSLTNLYDNRNKLFWVNESDILQNLESKVYKVYVAAGTPVFKATMTYTDPWGAANANPCRVNNLSLRVDAPGGTFYYGNTGMTGSGGANTTTAGGTADTRNNTQNVYVTNPTAGVWTVTVKAESLAADGHVETGPVDADYGLVVFGGVGSLTPTSVANYRPAAIRSGGVSEVTKSDGSLMQLQTPILAFAGQIAESGVVCNFTVPNGVNPTGYNVLAEGWTNLANIPYEIKMFNYTTNVYDLIHSSTAQQVKNAVLASSGGTAADYKDGAGNVKVVVEFKRDPLLIVPAIWQNKIDHVRLTPTFN